MKMRMTAGKSQLCPISSISLQLIFSSENSDEEKQGPEEDRMDEDTLPPTQSDVNDLSAYNLDDYDNEAADTGIPM